MGRQRHGVCVPPHEACWARWTRPCGGGGGGGLIGQPEEENEEYSQPAGAQPTRSRGTIEFRSLAPGLRRPFQEPLGFSRRGFRFLGPFLRLFGRSNRDRPVGHMRSPGTLNTRNVWPGHGEWVGGWVGSQTGARDSITSLPASIPPFHSFSCCMGIRGTPRAHGRRRKQKHSPPPLPPPPPKKKPNRHPVGKQTNQQHRKALLEKT